MPIEQKSNYKILNLVGQGQFGRVYAAVDLSSGSLVALKELRTKHLSTSSFLRELTFLVTLDHFNIVTCRALEHRERQRYLVMDYCEGGTLRSLMNQRERLPLNQSIGLIVDILRGLKYAHQRGIIHRDIKPENILLKSCARGYTAHIADFGIAKLNDELDPEDVVGNIGSPAYMAPEQFYGEYSHNCDLYGVGIILYELILGDRPFEGMPKALLPAHLSQAVSIPAHLPLILRLVIAKALEKLPQRRFQTAAEMLDALELMQAALESEIRTARRPKLDRSTSLPNLEPVARATVSSPVSHLTLASNKIFWTSNERLVQQSLNSRKTNTLEEAIAEREICLDSPIQSLQPNSDGCTIATSSALYHLSYDRDLDELSTLLSFPSIMATAVAPDQKWLAVSSITENLTARLAIYSVADATLKYSPNSDLSWHSLIVLDRRHLLGVHQNSDRQTELHLLNRRGHWLANFTVNFQFDKVIYNSQYPNRLLVSEVGNINEVVSIALEKFQLTRIPVNVAPELIKPCQQGYLVSDRYGRIQLLGHLGDCLARFQAPIPSDSEVTAIAVDESLLLLASTSESGSELHTFAWDYSMRTDS